MVLTLHTFRGLLVLPGEMGIDVLAYVDPDRDILERRRPRYTLGPPSVDLLFLDAERTEYAAYRPSRTTSASGPVSP